MRFANDEFQPDWVSPTGFTISSAMSQLGINQSEFAEQMKLTNSQAQDLLVGKTSINTNVARLLSNLLGGSTEFWLDRDKEYWRDLAKTPSSHPGYTNTTTTDWIKNFPLNDMIKNGWLQKGTTKDRLASELLNFFQVESFEEWQEKYRGELAVTAFRTSPSYESDPFSVVTWLRWAEKRSDEIACAPWNPALLREKTADLRKLTRSKSPTRFAPALKQICQACGVALVFAPAPKGCRASGATRFLSSKKALIVLSLRYKSDDHFWFTFFHEIGHLVLHSHDALFIEDGSDVSSEEEKEANEFAALTLIPTEYREEMQHLKPRANDIIRFSVKVGISPGVIVGQLQHAGFLAHNRFNRLKRKLDWRDFEQALAFE